MFGERFDSEGFSRVMPGVEDVEAEFLAERVGPMRSFAGDERVHALGGGSLEVAAGAAGDDANAPGSVCAAGNDMGLVADCAGQSAGEFSAGNVGDGLEADERTVTVEERAQLFETERGAKAGVVAEARMGVER